MENIFTQFNYEQRRCNCNASCEELSYDSIPSSALWPAKQYEKIAETNYGFGETSSAGGGGDGNVERPSMSENLLHVREVFSIHSLFSGFTFTAYLPAIA